MPRFLGVTMGRNRKEDGCKREKKKMLYLRRMQSLEKNLELKRETYDGIEEMNQRWRWKKVKLNSQDESSFTLGYFGHDIAPI